MCREEAHKLWSRRAELDAMGVRMACIVKEAIPEQIQQFVPTYWGETDMYLDENMEFFKAIGGGSLQKKGVMALMSSAVRSANSRTHTRPLPRIAALCCCDAAPIITVAAALIQTAVRAGSGAYLKSIGGHTNLRGEGWILGGLYVVRAGGEVELQHRESTFGDIAEVEDVMEAAARAAAASNTPTASTAVVSSPKDATGKMVDARTTGKKGEQEPAVYLATAVEEPAIAADATPAPAPASEPAPEPAPPEAPVAPPAGDGATAAADVAVADGATDGSVQPEVDAGGTPSEKL
jgi:hypothetical protein